jgi:ABC-type oligopeptide transport system substrate-binding subunit
MAELVTLHCVRERSKLRIRFHSFQNAEGKIYTNVYNNSYNCQFPREIRREGLFYQINSEDLALAAGGGGRQPFYRIRKSNIRIVERGPEEGLLEEAPQDMIREEVEKKSTKKKSKGKKAAEKATPTTSSAETSSKAKARPQQVFEVTECVICLASQPDTIFLPCAHLCTCSGCHLELIKTSRPNCPLCRRTVTDAIQNE